jgi:hypothetical protein
MNSRANSFFIFSMVGRGFLALMGSLAAGGIAGHASSSIASEAGTGSIYTCEPANAAAKDIGQVTFSLDTGISKLVFFMPVAWQVSVKAAPLEPPQDPPTITLQWVSEEHRAFFGQISWRDDATADPSTFGVRIGTNGEALWALWSCKLA